jgi:hypothetical protein
MRRLAVALAAVSCLLAAACVGVDPGTTGVCKDGEDVITYQELSDRQQSAFRQATKEGVTFVPNSPHVSGEYYLEEFGPFYNHDYVRHYGLLYRLEREDGTVYGSYDIHASPAHPGENQTAVPFDDLPATVQDEVETAIEEGEYRTHYGQDPSSFLEFEYVRYDNQTYELERGSVSDLWAKELHAEKVAAC